jgi:pectate lyase
MNIRKYKKILKYYILENKDNFNIGTCDGESIAIKDDKVYISLSNSKESDYHTCLTVSPRETHEHKEIQNIILDDCNDENLIDAVVLIAERFGKIHFNVFEGE